MKYNVKIIPMDDPDAEGRREGLEREHPPEIGSVISDSEVITKVEKAEVNGRPKIKLQSLQAQCATIVIDLDGTLCDCSHRVHLAQAKQWDEFHAGIPLDKPNPDVIQFIEWLNWVPQIIICTGRDERQRKATTNWIIEHGLGARIDTILMRPAGDSRPDHSLKIDLLADFFGGIEKAREKVKFILDDRDKVVDAWRDAGFRCWQVQAGSY